MKPKSLEFKFPSKTINYHLATRENGLYRLLKIAQAKDSDYQPVAVSFTLLKIAQAKDSDYQPVAVSFRLLKIAQTKDSDYQPVAVSFRLLSGFSEVETTRASHLFIRYLGNETPELDVSTEKRLVIYFWFFLTDEPNRQKVC